VTSSWSQAKQIPSKELEKEKYKIERTKKIRRFTKVSIGVVLCTIFEIPAIPVIAIFAITEIMDSRETNELSKHEK
jgi:hypothetical protein